ncbi:MAG: nucleoside monophosphate kinase [Candidatus Daviesbacteria bacterium]|nr:nucleoside monophosphate kinase [Candidatus Daviesbacteria bacterium]
MTKEILFLGVQGSGKSTQGKLLAQFLGLPYISTGDIFRGMGGEIRQILEQGRLVDDQTTSRIVEEKLREEEYSNGFVLDGYPRTMEQIKLFDPGFDKAIYLYLSDEEATKRLLARAREDDTVELIIERLRNYHKQTDPVLDYYREKGLLEQIDGIGSIEEIQQKIRDAVNG